MFHIEKSIKRPQSDAKQPSDAEHEAQNNVSGKSLLALCLPQDRIQRELIQSKAQ